MLDFPYDTAPAPGEVFTIRPGLLWVRLSLPFRLDHVNIYLIEDGDGWIIVDTGIDDKAGRAQWQALFDGALKGYRFNGLFVTHHHPDHIGLAGWLCDKLDIPLLTSQTAFLSAMNFYNSPELLAATAYSRFYASHGMTPEVAALVSTQGQEYMRMLSKPPFTYRRLRDGDILTLGGRAFHVLSGDGHCSEQLMLHLPEENLLLAADQVIEKISPNVSVMAFEPGGDPLGGFLHSLDRLRSTLPDDVLVLAGHRMPFYGLHDRCTALIAHHHERCDIIRAALATGPKSAAELVPVMFPRDLTPHEMSFAFTEVLAHTNYLVGTGDCRWLDRADGTRAITRA
ncbi:MBL fold metallo-hydrolase [Rhodobacterales bacterium 59_46_T64]|nr:MBL fold metallo-hydrolase [Rhodobacterales bacterium 59_46_T64]